MENPRPSWNFGKLTAMTSRRATSGAIASGSSWLSSHTPSGPGRSRSCARCSTQSASGTMYGPRSGSAGSVPSGLRLSRCQLSAAGRRSLMSVDIDAFLEGLDADAVYDVDEPLRLTVAPREIALDQSLDHLGHLGARE